MGYVTKVQVIARRNRTRQFYVLQMVKTLSFSSVFRAASCLWLRPLRGRARILPAPLAEALEVEKGEAVEWVVEDKGRLTVRRLAWAGRRASR